MKSKVAIITGASSGFGYLAALEAAAQGHRLVVTARRAERLDELVREVEARGGEAVAVAGDITDGAVQQRLVDGALGRWGRLDVLVNNAGVPLSGSFTQASLDDLRLQWNTNTTSVIELTKRALPALIDSNGIVIIVSSSLARFSIPGLGLYASSKVAASSIGDSLRRELVPHGVRVSIVEPGPYRTEFGQRAGMPSDGPGGFSAQEVAEAMVRLFERPKRLVVLPVWMRPLLAVGGGLFRALPDAIDLLFWAFARRQRERERNEAAAG